MSKKSKNLIEKFFHLKVESTYPPKEISSSGQGENNLSIAFTGVSGAGKSTFRRYYLKHSKLEEIRDVVTYKTLISYARGLPEDFLLRGFYLRLFMHYLSFSQNSVNAKLRIIKMDFITRHFFRNKIFLLDTRNIFREFPGISEFLLKEKKVDGFFKNRIIVHFMISPEQLIKRIKNRKRKTGKSHKWQLSLHKDDYSLYLLKDKIQREEDEVKRMEELGASVFRINAEESLAFNTSQVDKYIHNYQGYINF